MVIKENKFKKLLVSLEELKNDLNIDLGIPLEWQMEYNISFLYSNESLPAVKQLQKIRKDHLGDYGALLNTIKLQLQSKGLLKNDRKLQHGKKHKDIIELKSQAGGARLFCFLSKEGKLIICTGAYWKTATHRKVQDQEFSRADDLRKSYLNNEGNDDGC